MTQTGDLLTTLELARELKRSPETLMRWRRQRSGPPYVRMQGRVLYDSDQVARWLRSNTVDTADAA